MRSSSIVRGILLFVAVAVLASAQQFPFQLVATQAGNSLTIQNGAGLALIAAVGETRTVRITAAYTGTGQVRVLQPPTVFGSNAFTATFVGTLPVTLNPSGSLSFDVEFHPTSVAQYGAQVTLPFSETLPPTTDGGSPTTTQGTIGFTLQGTVPSFTLSYVLQTDLNVIPLQPGESIAFPPSLINATAQAGLNITNVGSGAGAITGISITGDAFRLSGIPLLPATLTAGQNMQVLVLYRPTSVAADAGQITITFSDGSVVTINLQGTGTASSFALSYVLSTDQNVVPLQPGDSILFPASPINNTVQALLNVTNLASGPGTITGITISGDAFHLSGVPLLPATVAAGQTLQVFVLYRPVSVGTDVGQISISFSGSQAVTIKLQGSGIVSNFVYKTLQTDPPTIVAPGGIVTFVDTNIGETSSITLQVMNSGTASNSVNSIAIAGQGYQLSNLPVLPQTLAPGASLTFNVTFSPTQPATLTGRLTVNSDVLNLSGKGLGSQLVFSYVAGGSTITLSSTNNSVVFSPVMITHAADLSFVARNTGTAPATISNIGIGQLNGPFSISTSLALPVILAPDADLPITLTFTPTVLGFSNGTLQFDTTTIALVGSGTKPPPLPAYTIVGPGGAATPMSQPEIGLSLASPYPVAISGTLTLTISSDLPADPAVQFATGGRTVPFVIPANNTDAVFAEQGTQVRLQTGTVVSNMTLTPSFATQAGNVDLNPASPTVLQFSVAPAAPTLIAVQLSNRTDTSLTIVATGFTTTRSLTTWQVQFTPVSGVQMPASQFTFDIGQLATTWFRGTASQAFGGQFTVSIPFTFQGTLSSGKPLLSGIDSVTVTMNNEVGASNSPQAKLQ